MITVCIDDSDQNPKSWRLVHDRYRGFQYRPQFIWRFGAAMQPRFPHAGQA
jgi:hypothetical protein